MKYCAKLRTSPSERSQAGATLLAGSTIISEVCGGNGGANGNGKGGGSPLAPRVLFLAPDADAPPGIPRALLTLRAPAEVLARLAGLATATTAGGRSISLSAVAVVDLPRESDFLSLSQNNNSSSSRRRPPLRRLLALDGVQDPGNVGTLARTALALGWDGLYCLPGTADPWGDKSTRAARGAAWRLPVRSRGASWGELLEVARGSGLDFLVAEPREEEEEEEKRPRASGEEESRGVCLVLGSEGSGLSAEGRAALAGLGGSSSGSSRVAVSSVSIPMSGEMESLNVATAGAVLMFALSAGAGDFVRRLDKRR